MTKTGDPRSAVFQNWDAAAHLGRRPERAPATRADLERLQDDRKNDPARAELAHPAPPWAAPDVDSDLRRRQARERRIHYLTNRLDAARQKIEQDFDPQ